MIDFSESDRRRAFTIDHKIALKELLSDNEFDSKIKASTDKIVNLLNVLISDYIVDPKLKQFLSEHPECENICRMTSGVGIDTNGLFNAKKYSFDFFKLSIAYDFFTLNFEVDPFPAERSFKFNDSLFKKCPKKFINLLSDYCLDYINLRCYREDFLIETAKTHSRWCRCYDYFNNMSTWLDLYSYNQDWYLLLKRYYNNIEIEKKKKTKENFDKVNKIFGICY